MINYPDDAGPAEKEDMHSEGGCLLPVVSFVKFLTAEEKRVKHRID